jgi:hypothetical protein
MVMAASDLIECVPTSAFFIHSLSSPIASTASQRALITFADVTCVHPSLIITVEMSVSLLVAQILLTIDAVKQTGQSVTLLDAICVTVSIFSSFFCCSNVIERNLQILINCDYG